MNWLCYMIKEIWYCLLTFEALGGGKNESAGDEATLDLKFLIQLEQEGF